MMLSTERLERSMFFDQSTAGLQSWRVANALASRNGTPLFIGGVSTPA